MIADLYRKIDNYDSALLYYERYEAALPQQYGPLIKLGDFYRKFNDVDKAREYYGDALLLAPLSERALILDDLADLDLILGRFDEAYDQYMEALKSCNSSQDSTEIYSSLQTFSELKGQYRKAVEFHEHKVAEMTKTMAPKDIMVYRVFTIDIYAMANNKNRAIEILEEIAKELEPPLDNVIPIGYMFLYAYLGETEKAEEAMAGVEKLARDFGEEGMLANVAYARGMVAESRENYEEAIKQFNDFLAFQPSSYSVYRNIARCYRKIAQYNDAEDQLMITLNNRPFDPENCYEAALLYLETGDTDKAREYLELACEIWKDADEDYPLAAEAHTRLEELQND